METNYLWAGDTNQCSKKIIGKEKKTFLIWWCLYSWGVAYKCKKIFNQFLPKWFFFFFHQTFLKCHIGIFKTFSVLTQRECSNKFKVHWDNVNQSIYMKYYLFLKKLNFYYNFNFKKRVRKLKRKYVLILFLILTLK